MIKKFLPVISMLVLVGLALFATFHIVRAQDVPPVTPDPLNDFGRGRMGGGMMGDGQGLMSEYMLAALANQLDITVDELAERKAEGQTLWQIAEELGFSQEEAGQMMMDARSAALEKMVADGVITQEQADWMKQRSTGMLSGRGGCTGTGTPRGGRSGR